MNINGALMTDVVVVEDERINAESAKRLYEALLAHQPVGKVYGICDNARYYRNRELGEWLKEKRI